MLTARGVGLLAAAVLLWIGSRVLGAPDLHMVAVGLAILAPSAAGLMWWLWQDVDATRRMSSRRVFPGNTIRVEVELANRRRVPTPLLLLEDRLPPQLGRHARVLLPGVPAGGRCRVSYDLTPPARGRYVIGPLSATVTDPFVLARQRVELPVRDEILVYPKVEELGAERTTPTGAGSGESSARRLFRSGREFYTIRGYETGDDLRKIHWPSTARTGELMIRQEEAARRSTAVVVLDSRAASLGARSALFERGVSAAASIGLHYLRSGYTVRLAAADAAPRAVQPQELLETLAVIEPSRQGTIGPALRRVADPGAAHAGLVVVTHVPLAEETTRLVQAGRAYDARIAILVGAEDPAELPASRLAEVRAWSDAARAALARAGWQTISLSPSTTLRSRWHTLTPPRSRAIASS